MNPVSGPLRAVGHYIPRPISTWHHVGIRNGAKDHRVIAFHLRFTCKLRQSERANERTRTADLVSLRVMHQALQALAQGCKPRISKPIPLPSLARRCTVLHSRWCQSGVNIILIFAGHPRPSVASHIQSVAEGGPGLPPIRRFDEAPVPLGRHGVRLVVSSSTSTSSRLTCSSTVQVSSTIQAELRLLACGWRFESVHYE